MTRRFALAACAMRSQLGLRPCGSRYALAAQALPARLTLRASGLGFALATRATRSPLACGWRYALAARALPSRLACGSGLCFDQNKQPRSNCQRRERLVFWPNFPTLAEKVADMSAACRLDSQMLALLAKMPLSRRHNFDPDTFFCVGICRHPPNFPL